jgi:hypothetical protein
MSADQKIETIKSIYEAFGLGDVEAILVERHRRRQVGAAVVQLRGPRQRLPFT